MAPMIVVIFFVAVALATSRADSTTTNHYASARVESCSGCRLTQLPDVKQFIFEDLPNYSTQKSLVFNKDKQLNLHKTLIIRYSSNNVEFKHIPGAVPKLLLFNENEEEVERLPLSSLTREECNNLLISKGFTKKTAKDEI